MCRLAPASGSVTGCVVRRCGSFAEAPRDQRGARADGAGRGCRQCRRAKHRIPPAPMRRDPRPLENAIVGTWTSTLMTVAFEADGTVTATLFGGIHRRGDGPSTAPAGSSLTLLVTKERPRRGLSATSLPSRRMATRSGLPVNRVDATADVAPTTTGLSSLTPEPGPRKQRARRERKCTLHHRHRAP